jgi:intracellular multiplication protein IcmE
MRSSRSIKSSKKELSPKKLEISKHLLNVELKYDKYSLSNLKRLGFTAKDCKEAGYSAKDCKEAGYYSFELNDVGYTIPELLIAGFDINKLFHYVKNIYDLQFLLFNCETPKCNFDKIKNIIDINNLNELIKDGKKDGKIINPFLFFKKLGYPILDIKKLGYKAKDFMDSGFYTYEELKEGDFSENELENQGYLNIKKENFTIEELKSAGFTAQDFKDNGFSNDSIQKLLKAGYGYNELIQAKFDQNKVSKLFTERIDSKQLSELSKTSSYQFGGKTKRKCRRIKTRTRHHRNVPNNRSKTGIKKA